MDDVRWREIKLSNDDILLDRGLRFPIENR